MGLASLDSQWLFRLLCCCMCTLAASTICAMLLGFGHCCLGLAFRFAAVERLVSVPVACLKLLPLHHYESCAAVARNLGMLLSVDCSAWCKSAFRVMLAVQGGSFFVIRFPVEILQISAAGHESVQFPPSFVLIMHRCCGVMSVMVLESIHNVSVCVC